MLQVVTNLVMMMMNLTMIRIIAMVIMFEMKKHISYLK